MYIAVDIVGKDWTSFIELLSVITQESLNIWQCVSSSELVHASYLAYLRYNFFALCYTIQESKFASLQM